MNSVSPNRNPVSDFSLSTGMDYVSADPTQSLESAAKGLEQTFLSVLVKEMRQGLEPDTLFGHDSGDVFGGMFDQFMAQHLTQGGGIGLAKSLNQQLKSMHSHENDPPDHSKRT